MHELMGLFAVFDSTKCPPCMSQLINRKLGQLSGESDIYRPYKAAWNTFLLHHEQEFIQDIVAHSIHKGNSI